MTLEQIKRVRRQHAEGVGIANGDFEQLCCAAERALVLRAAIVALNELGFAGDARIAQAEICADALAEEGTYASTTS